MVNILEVFQVLASGKMCQLGIQNKNTPMLILLKKSYHWQGIVSNKHVSPYLYIFACVNHWSQIVFFVNMTMHIVMKRKIITDKKNNLKKLKNN